MVDHICPHCTKRFSDTPGNKRKYCSLRCSQASKKVVRTTPEYRRLRKIWDDMRRYANREIERGVPTAEVDLGWKASFFIFQRWASAAGYSTGQRFARIDKTKGYEPNNCHFIKEVVPS